MICTGFPGLCFLFTVIVKVLRYLYKSVCQVLFILNRIGGICLKLMFMIIGGLGGLVANWVSLTLSLSKIDYGWFLMKLNYVLKFLNSLPVVSLHLFILQLFSFCVFLWCIVCFWAELSWAVFESCSFVVVGWVCHCNVSVLWVSEEAVVVFWAEPPVLLRIDEDEDVVTEDGLPSSGQGTILCTGTTREHKSSLSMQELPTVSNIPPDDDALDLVRIVEWLIAMTKSIFCIIISFTCL